MRAHLHYLDRIDALEVHNGKKERQRINGGDDGSDEDAVPGSGSEDEGKATAAEQRAAKKKRTENAEKKKKAGESKAVQVKVDSGLEVTSSGDVKTARAAASLFGPAKAAAEEQWIDLPYYESTVSVRSAWMPVGLLICISNTVKRVGLGLRKAVCATHRQAVHAHAGDAISSFVVVYWRIFNSFGSSPLNVGLAFSPVLSTYTLNPRHLDTSRTFELICMLSLVDCDY